MLNQLSHCTLVSCILLSKNKIDDGARSKAVCAADGGQSDSHCGRNMSRRQESQRLVALKPCFMHATSRELLKI